MIAVTGAMLCAALAGYLLPRGGPPAGARLALLLPGQGEARRRGRSVSSAGGPAMTTPTMARAGRGAVLKRWGAGALAGVACAALLGGPLAGPAGVLVGALCVRALSRMEPRWKRRRRVRLIADLPIAIDLLAACLRCGSAWAEAVEAVADAIGGPLADELRGVSTRVRLGAEPTQAWLELTAEPVLAPLARAVARAAAGGSALAPTLARLAQDQRSVARSAALARARTAGIRAVAPLGLCFLPAFILLGVIPAIAGLAATILLPGS